MANWLLSSDPIIIKRLSDSQFALFGNIDGIAYGTNSGCQVVVVIKFCKEALNLSLYIPCIILQCVNNQRDAQFL